MQRTHGEKRTYRGRNGDTARDRPAEQLQMHITCRSTVLLVSGGGRGLASRLADITLHLSLHRLVARDHFLIRFTVGPTAWQWLLLFGSLLNFFVVPVVMWIPSCYDTVVMSDCGITVIGCVRQWKVYRAVLCLIVWLKFVGMFHYVRLWFPCWHRCSILTPPFSGSRSFSYMFDC